MSKKQLIVYNSNKPKELFTCIHIDEECLGIPAGCTTISADQYAIIEATCEGGPYLAFFRDWPDTFYTFFKMAHPLDATGEDAWYNLRITCIQYDAKQQDIVASLLRKICEVELRAQAEENEERRKHAPDKGDIEKNK